VGEATDAAHSKGAGFISGARMILTVREGRVASEEEALLRDHGFGAYDVRNADIPA
jgi:hypothetical protein